MIGLGVILTESDLLPHSWYLGYMSVRYRSMLECSGIRG